MSTRHLDLGCGTKPRNPYGRSQLYGLDIRSGLSAPGVQEIRAANLSCAPIPFASDYFDSVSAYDFLEHIPRASIDHANGKTHFPFIELMNEIWRVLKPEGVFYAITPAYPHEKAFRDPTHVNIIADKTYRYFCQPHLQGAMYGFHGDFQLKRQVRCHPRKDYEPNTLLATLRRSLDRVAGQSSHLAWEMAAVKKPKL